MKTTLLLAGTLTTFFTTICCANTSVLNSHETLNSRLVPCTHKEIVWFQHAAERKAIDYEVFLAAENSIKAAITAQKLQPKQWGVVLDIDETVLDNSAWNYQHYINHSTQTWDQFAALSKSTAIPGAAEFTNHIHALGGYVNLVSNRNSNLLDATKKNLNDQHVYFDQVLLDTTKQGTSFVDKNIRFNAVTNGKSPSTLPPQKIIAWLGDNIQDFPDLKQTDFRNNPNNRSLYASFGKTYFVLPNPLYGSWE
jgi:5'-nucleotidase (lipoprotein e(P4) family)